MQRVDRAAVRVDGEVVGSIGAGLCVLVGVTHTDTDKTAHRMAKKLLELRILEGEKSAADLRAPLLVVSQFTLYGDTTRGRRPSWLAAAPRPVAEPLVDELVGSLRKQGAEVAVGRFGAQMALELVNNGPVTLVLDLP